MKLHIHFQTGDFKVNEEVSGENADVIVASMQKRVAQEAGFLVGAVIRNMTPLQFAREATRRYNAALKGRRPIAEQLRRIRPDGYRQKLRDGYRRVGKNSKVGRANNE